MLKAELQGLRRIRAPKPVRAIAVTSGKGGVGKTSVSVNLAVALALAGRKTMLLDADLALANVDVLLGLQPVRNLSHVVKGECTLEEILLEGPGGLQVVPAASGLAEMAALGTTVHAGVIRAFSELVQDLDVLMIDTAAGISASVLDFAAAAQDVVVVVCDEPASLTDAYALIKLLHLSHGVRCFHVLANQASSALEGRRLYEQLARTAARFLGDATLHYFGALPHDEYLRTAVQRQRAVVEAFPRARTAVEFRKLAEKAAAWPAPPGARGHLEFFFERLIQSRRGAAFSIV